MRTAIKQHDLSDCGAAALCSVARYFGRDIPLTVIREASGTDRAGKESEDLQRYVGYLFDAGFRFSLEDSRAIMGTGPTTLYAYRSESTGRVVVIGIAQVDELSAVTVSYTK